MMRFFRDFFRQIRNGFRNLFRNGWMTLASILTMTVTLLMVGGLVMLLSNVDNITRDIEEGVQIRAHIDLVADKEDEETLQQSIEAIDHVEDVTYRTKEQELEDLIANVGEEFALFDNDANPLFNVFVVSVDDSENLDSVTEAISQLPYAVDVTYGEIDTQNLLRTLEVIRIVFALIAAILVVIAVALISNTIKLTIYARQTEIEIMRLVGAKNSYIRAPFTYEGAFIGLISAIFASVLLYGAYEGLQTATVEITGVQVIAFTPTMPFILYIAGGLVIVGILLGIIGARRSIKRFLTI
ncbi:permease-like cell division protein FtsX [Aerococcaceae bacterium WGS1372]